MITFNSMTNSDSIHEDLLWARYSVSGSHYILILAKWVLLFSFYQ